MGRPKNVEISNEEPETFNCSANNTVVRRASKRKKVIVNDSTNEDIKSCPKTSESGGTSKKSEKRSNVDSEPPKKKSMKNMYSPYDSLSPESSVNVDKKVSNNINENIQNRAQNTLSCLKQNISNYSSKEELEKPANIKQNDSRKVVPRAPKRKNLDNGNLSKEKLQNSVTIKDKLCNTTKRMCKKSNININDPGEDLKRESAKSKNLKPVKNLHTSFTSTTVNDDEKETIVVKKTDSSVELCSVEQNAESLMSGDSSSEDEWEEVQENNEQNIDDYKPDIPKEGVEITIDCPDLKVRRRQKKEFDENECIRLYINRMRKAVQLSVHKVHLLCLLAQGLIWNKILNLEELKGIALSLIPMSNLIPSSKINKIRVEDIEKILLWYRECFTLEQIGETSSNVLNRLTKCFETQTASDTTEYNMMFVIIARSLGLKVRLCMSLYPITYKASNLIKKEKDKTKSKSALDQESSPKLKPKKSDINAKEKNIKCVQKAKRKVTSVKNINKLKNDKPVNRDVERQEPSMRPQRSKEKSYKMSSDEDEQDDEDFELPTEKLTTKSAVKKNRKILSSDSDTSLLYDFKENRNGIKCWTEIYSKPTECWIPIECANNLVNKPYEIEAVVVQPVSYILAIDNNSYVKDVTRRYCSEFMTVTRKLRVCSDWWEESLEPFMPPNTKADKEEENKLEMTLANKPMPTTISGFKNHPLYALKRHLLKFEAIYPSDAPSIGFIRNEAVYARECVCQLHSRETWVKEARVVRVGEEPYKIVKARPKWDRIACELKTDLPLEIFGEWQTEPYQPPEAKNGKVPRNEYGNVELFKPCMLPIGTVHLQIPGLNRVAKKLGIDCSAAVVGFDGHKGSIHPVYDGFVVCKEFEDTLLAAWDEDQVNARKREEEKREKRIYGNWRKLIRGLLIRERLKLKYNVK